MSGGVRARNNGIVFENTFRAMASYSGFAVTRMPDGCRPAGKTLIRVKTAFDWICSRGGKTILVDTKTTANGTFPHSAICHHQAAELVGHHAQGVYAGYVVELRAVDSVIFIPANILTARMYAVRGSIAPSDNGIVVLGSSARFDLNKVFS